MATNNIQTTALPGGKANSASKSDISSISSTQLMYRELKKKIEESSSGAVIAGQDVFVIERDSFNAILGKINDAVASGKSSSVSNIQVSEMNREIASLKLRLCEFQSASERLEFANMTLAGDLSQTRTELDKAKSDKVKAVNDHLALKKQLQPKFDALNAEGKRLKAEILQAKADKAAELEKTLSLQKKENSDRINLLNKTLEEANSAIVIERERVKRFERHILALQTDLNVEKTRVSIEETKSGVKPTFAAAAKAAGTDTVDLVNRVYAALRDKSKGDLKHLDEIEKEDYKSMAFWMTAAADHSKHPLLRPYSKTLHGVLDDMKNISWSARKEFLPFLQKVKESFTPNGKPYSEKELETLLEDTVDPRKLVLAKSYRKPGIKTLNDYIRESNKSRQPQVASEGSDASSPEPPLRRRNARRGRSLSSVAPLRLRLASVPPMPIEEPMAPMAQGPSETSPPPPDDEKPKGFFAKVKAWFSSIPQKTFGSLRSNLQGKPQRARAYMRLSLGNFFQRIAAVPYSWWAVWF